jgi:pimeloyl-ACP methyl ester carboxylesterase
MEPFLNPITEAAIAAAHPAWGAEDVRFKVAALKSTSPEVLRRTIWENHREFKESVDLIDVPTLIIGADPDLETLVTPEMGEGFAARNPHVTFTWIEGAGHSMHREDYEAFTRAVLGFVD